MKAHERWCLLIVSGRSQQVSPSVPEEEFLLECWRRDAYIRTDKGRWPVALVPTGPQLRTRPQFLWQELLLLACFFASVHFFFLLIRQDETRDHLQYVPQWTVTKTAEGFDCLSKIAKDPRSEPLNVGRESPLPHERWGWEPLLSLYKNQLLFRLCTSILICHIFLLVSAKS
jgi:hypothetical protein